MLRGNLDYVDSAIIQGWAADESDPRLTVSVLIAINGKTLEVEAGEYRPDLEAAFGPGLGRHGFSVSIGDHTLPGANSVEAYAKRGAELLRLGGYTLKREGAGAPAHDFFGDESTFRFPSVLQQKVLAEVPVHSLAGRAALKKALAQTRIILVLFTNRTGSNLVCDMLESMGCGMGATNEPFLAESIIGGCAKDGFESIEAYLAAVILHWRSNGVCFLKISWDALFWLTSEGILWPLVENATFIRCKRNDKVLQAISYLKALETGVFHVRKGEGSAQAKGGGHQFEMSNERIEGIASAMHHFTIAEGRIDYFLQMFPRPCLEIVYEELVGDLEASRRSIRGFLQERLGLALPDAAFEPSLAKQSGASDLAIKERFLDEMRERIRGRRPA